ncbi:MAG: 1,4-alpha-glucan branching protein GlgB [Longimicrobiales bacterium]|nr:1,4-alpha-glucan branching protein GlgB [Longimicrobiales bacterium]
MGDGDDRAPVPRSLSRLARLHGIQTRYKDNNAEWRTASAEALRAILDAMGVDATSEESVEEATRTRKAELDRRVLEPVTPVTLEDEGEPPRVPVHLPEGAGDAPLECRLRTESGRVTSWEAAPGPEIRLPQPLPVGYHELEISWAEDTADTLLLAAPATTWRPETDEDDYAEAGEDARDWGVFLPLYALRSKESWGTGHFRDLERLLEWTDRLGGDVVGTLPLLAGAEGSAEDARVYSPVSRLFWNEAYLDVEEAPGLETCEEAREVLESEEFQEDVRRLREADLVDWKGSVDAKRAILEPLAVDYLDAGTDRIRAFLEARPEADAYARFQATWEIRGEPWHQWPDELKVDPGTMGGRDPTSGSGSDPDPWQRAYRYHLYVQWLADRQMRRVRDAQGARGPGVYLDLPLGCDPAGFDAWRHRDLFADGISVGSPPDAFFSEGQDWGFPPLLPDAMARRGFEYTIACLRHHMRFADRLRLDHVMGLHRLFWIPRGMPAREGVYVRYPHEALYAVLCIESHRHRCAIVGEDLGTVPREVRRSMNRHRIDRMYVAQFEGRLGRDPFLPAPHPRSLASVNTHDTATFTGFWTGEDIDTRVELDLLDPTDAAKERTRRVELRREWIRFLEEQGELGGRSTAPTETAAGPRAPASEPPDDSPGIDWDRMPRAVLLGTLRHLARSRASLLLVNLEDLWLEERPQNVPGTGTERPNFRRKARMNLEEIVSLDIVSDPLREVDELRRPGKETTAAPEVREVPPPGPDPTPPPSEPKPKSPPEEVPVPSPDEPPRPSPDEVPGRPDRAPQPPRRPPGSESGSGASPTGHPPATDGAVDAPESATTTEEPAEERVKEGVKEPVRTDTSPITDDDLHLFNEGRHFRLHHKLGSHRVERDGETGVHFAVWAPNAREVTVIGDFNGWDKDRHPLQPRGESGIWEGFVPGIEKGARYKYHIRSRQGDYEVDKADPFAVRHETPPKTASVVWDLEYDWGDGAWMEERGEKIAADAPVSIYEVHPGSWKRAPKAGSPEEGTGATVEDAEAVRAAEGESAGDFRPLTYRELAPRLIDHLDETGFTHVELLPVMEHPFYGSWGYQTTGYFAPTSRYGTPQDLMYLIDQLHQAGYGVILDWVPSHFPGDEHGLAYFDGTHLFEHADPREGFHPDWKSYIFNYGRHEVRSFLVSSAIHWLEHFHADGLRVDAVASMLYRDYGRKHGEWIPNEYGGRENLGAIQFLRELNEEVYRTFPDVQTMAEESTAWPMVSRPTYLGGLGFGMKWDMGWMHDTLDYLEKEPVHRSYHHDELTFRRVYAFSENFVLPLSHDEVVHGKGSLLEKMPGDDWQKFANLRLLLAYQIAQPAKKLLFMGGEFGQRREWSHDESLDWHLLEHGPHAGVQQFVGDLNRVYRDEPALHELDFEEAGFQWIDANDSAQSVLSFLRLGKSDDEIVAAVFNFTPVPRNNYRIGVPRGGVWREILNSDAEGYGGSGKGNLGRVEATPVPFHGRPHSLVLSLPPLGAVFLKAPQGSGPTGSGGGADESRNPQGPGSGEPESRAPGSHLDTGSRRQPTGSRGSHRAPGEKGRGRGPAGGAGSGQSWSGGGS